MIDVFKALMVAGPAVICFTLNAPMVMKPSKPLLNKFKEIDIVLELGTEENQQMTDAFCDIKKSDFNRLKYVQSMDKLNGKSDWYEELWDVRRVIRHRGRPGKTEVLCQFKDANKSEMWVNMFAQIGRAHV